MHLHTTTLVLSPHSLSLSPHFPFFLCLAFKSIDGPRILGGRHISRGAVAVTMDEWIVEVTKPQSQREEAPPTTAIWNRQRRVVVCEGAGGVGTRIE